MTTFKDDPITKLPGVRTTGDDSKVEIPRNTFFQGLLLAMRSAGAPDTIYMADLNAAFASVVHLLDDRKIGVMGRVKRDPVFNIFHEVDELVIQGETDGIINHLGNVVTFVLSTSKARHELLEFKDWSWLIEAGNVFVNALRGAKKLPLKSGDYSQ